MPPPAHASAASTASAPPPRRRRLKTPPPLLLLEPSLELGVLSLGLLSMRRVRMLTDQGSTDSTKRSDTPPTVAALVSICRRRRVSGERGEGELGGCWRAGGACQPHPTVQPTPSLDHHPKASHAVRTPWRASQSRSHPAPCTHTHTLKGTINPLASQHTHKRAPWWASRSCSHPRGGRCAGTTARRRAPRCPPPCPPAALRGAKARGGAGRGGMQRGARHMGLPARSPHTATSPQRADSKAGINQFVTPTDPPRAACRRRS